MVRVSLLVCLLAGCSRHADTVPPGEAPESVARATPEPIDAAASAPVEPAPNEGAPAERVASEEPRPTGADASVPASEPPPVASTPAPDPSTQQAPPREPLVADANVTVESIAADGLELRQLACAVDGGMPMFGTLAIAGTLAKQKKAIDRCAPAGQAFAVTWTFVGGKVKGPVANGGSAKANTCIAKAVAKAAAPMDGRCGAIVLAGDVAKAEASIAALP